MLAPTSPYLCLRFWTHRRFAALGLALLTAASACGQQGVVATSASGGGGSGSSAMGGAGGGIGGGGGGTGGEANTTPEPLAVFNWNARNFFDTKKDDFQNADEIVLSATDYQTKRQIIGAVISQLNPDVAVLSEIEHLSILDDLNKSELGGAYVATALIEGNDSRGIDIGVMSKIPFDQVVSHKDDSFTVNGTNGPFYRYTRDCLELHLTYNGRHVVLLGVHFRSKGGTDDPDKRLAEAQRTRAIANGIAKADPKAAIVVLGDFNDVPGSLPYKAVLGAQPSLYGDVADEVPSAHRYSYDYMGTLELIDHQMSTPLLYGMLKPGSVVLLHGQDIDSGGKYASDHAPLMATYLIK